MTQYSAARTTFADRHIGPSPDDQARMLAVLGYSDVEALVGDAVPDAIRTDRPLDLPPALDEAAALRRLRELAGRNQVLTSMIGLGYHGTLTPGVILRNVLENPGWYTAYTPYQPEISQGRLEALLNFQTVVSDLTGLPVSGASMLDEGTAAAEAMALAHRVSRRKDPGAFLIDADVLPQTIEVVRTRAEPLGIEVVVADLAGGLVDGDFFGVLLQYPGAGGVVRDLAPIAGQAHERGAQVVVAADLLALTLLTPPGEFGADVVVGSAQRFGVPYGFGGPHAGYLAVREGIQRQLPGRLVGVSVDADGRPAYRLALQTREQHIRREKATSNICTAQVLLAVMAGMYAVYHGPEGLTEIARRVHAHARALAAGLRDGGVEVVHEHFFDTVLARVPGRAAEVVAAAAERGVNLWLADADHVGISCSETTVPDHLTAVWAAFGITGTDPGRWLTGGGSGSLDGLPADLHRDSPFLTHPVFHEHRSETAMLRYLRRLQDRDIALDRSMIPLGSCTMKLNATTEMEPITWPEFADIHPFAPLDQARGYLELIGELEDWLAEITGYARVSVQPNAGSQGELAGLLAIRGYHVSRGEEHRDVCLIPSSAHGTNAASAVMAGMRVVVVACDEAGNIDVDDLHAKVDKHRDTLSAIMVTYPSTHGVYEETITEVCATVHAAGGQVYVDGANLNALVGLARPGEFGSDVSHLNLHKTFCIPHGGGGPGVGPIGVREHLAPFLPGHPLRAEAGPETGPGPISAAPWGSAGILPIPWAYIAMMGPDGLRQATEGAILAANYVARRLAPHYPILYTGRAGLVAHECIADLRKLTKETGITAEDVAKRLIDYGFHAPTLSFPVAGTLMIEPTESEDLTELDRFCDAMIAIRREIEQVASGEYDRDDNPLKNAPHTADHLLTDDWKHAYGRAEAAYPLPSLREAKYWPPVRRIDQAHGDRNLVCSCPPPESFED
ncbi:glycine dehydrogenase (aminomethyl-transferring) [Actinomadura craniellae]|uniref:Glycine dehydrogenase (decarboxylating) n=1 Tax=Actinomadura craniellae TaxID=2231787 RepID=A0A365GWC5_9ACTN|nr:aminomethyl-transferring glycine dehydrogenase [Actinomadura craniellae]RAY11104.1 glycine dehydrogenase (aminomethyl-transferring) [Actinomadura craniellae]